MINNQDLACKLTGLAEQNVLMFNYFNQIALSFLSKML